MHDKFINKYEKLRKVDSQSSMTGLKNFQRKNVQNSFDRVKKTLNPNDSATSLSPSNRR